MTGGLLDALGDLDDIEDIIGENDVGPKDRYKNKPVPVPKSRKIKKKSTVVSPEAESPAEANNNADGRIQQDEGNFLDTGSRSVYVKTWGCAHNSSDSEYMAGQLAAQGYSITQDKEEAALWLLNSCTVKNPAEEHFKNEINKGLDNNKKVVVAGCVPQGVYFFAFTLSPHITTFISFAVFQANRTLNTCRGCP